MKGLPEARRMIRSAASTASVPVVRNRTLFVLFGQTARSFSASCKRCALLAALVQQTTPDSFIIACTASTTSGLQLPTLLVAQPAPKSMNRLPSTSSIRDPEARSAMKKRSSIVPYAPWGKSPSSRAMSLRLSGPGGGVFINETRGLEGMGRIIRRPEARSLSGYWDGPRARGLRGGGQERGG